MSGSICCTDLETRSGEELSQIFVCFFQVSEVENSGPNLAEMLLCSIIQSIFMAVK